MYASNLTPRQREILATWGVKGPARAKAQAALGVTAEELAVLHFSGFLKTLPTGGVYLADGGVLVLGPKMRDRLTQLVAQIGAPAAAVIPLVLPVALEASAAPAPKKAPKAPRARRVPPEDDPVFAIDHEARAWVAERYQAQLAKAEAGETYVSAFFGWVDKVPAPQPPAIGADCAKWRRMILKGESLVRAVGGKVRGPNAGTKLLPRVENIYGEPGASPYPTVIGRVFHPFDQVICPTCEAPIAFSTWWGHGCPKALVDRAQVLGDFKELTDGAAETSFEEAA